MRELVKQDTDGHGVLDSKYVVLYVYHPTVPSLDLVDLPGFTNQEGRSEKVKAIIKKEIENDKATGNHSMFLAVVPASARPNTNVAVSFLKDNGLQDRAFGVFSQCDEA